MSVTVSRSGSQGSDPNVIRRVTRDGVATDSGQEPGGLQVVLAAHGEAETAGFFENWRIGHRTLAHSAEVMRLPVPLRWTICSIGAMRKRVSGVPGSPHNAWTRAQAAALARKLEVLLDEPVTVRAAFASSEPSVEGLIERPSTADRRIFVSMSPSDSRLSCGLLCHALARTKAPAGQDEVLARLWDDPEFTALNVGHLKQRCAAWPGGPGPDEAAKTALILVFHGTLVKDRNGRMPGFHTGLAEKSHFADALQAALSADSDLPWTEVVPAYLNHDVAGAWTQPTVESVLQDLSRRRFERVWVFPCDFLVEGGEINGSLRSSLALGPIPDVRVLPCLNDSPELIDYLAKRIQRALIDPAAGLQCDACPRRTRAPAELDCTRFDKGR